MGKKRKTNKNLPQRVYFKHGSYYFVTYQNKWIRLSSNFAVAIAKYAELIDSPTKLNNMNDLIDRYMREIAPKNAKKTYEGNIHQAKKLRSVFGQMKPSEIDATNIYSYLDIRGKVAPVQANREVSLLSNMFKRAIRWGIAQNNPCVGIEKNKETPRTRYITDEEFKKRKEVMPEWLSCMMEISYLTSLRRGDVLKINLKDITPEVLKIVQSKTNKKQDFWLIDENGRLNDLGKVIQKTKKINRPISSIFLFSNRRGRPYTDSGFDSIWQRYSKKDGIQNFHFHDIRAKAITDADEQGRNAQKLSGHKSRAMVERYIKVRKIDKVQPLKNIQ